MKYRYHGKLLLIIIALVICQAVLPCRSASTAHAASSKGYWKQVKVENLGLSNTNVPAHMKDELFLDFSSKRGRVEGKVRQFSEDDNGRFTVLDINVAGHVSWREPPREAKPGDIWDGQFKAEITENFLRGSQQTGNRNQLYMGVFVVGQLLHQPSGVITKAFHNPDAGLAITSHSLKHKTWNSLKNNRYVFPDPNPGAAWGTYKYMAIQVSTCTLFNDVTDSYVYYYEWVPGVPEKITGNLLLRVQHNYRGNVGKLKVKITNLEDGSEFVQETDDQGELKRNLQTETTKDHIPLRIDSFTITKDTFYTVPMEGKFSSHVHMDADIEVKVNRDIPIHPSSKQSITTHTLNLPLTRVTLLPLKWDMDANRWVSCKAGIIGQTPTVIRQFVIRPAQFKKDDKGKFYKDVFFPDSSILKIRRMDLTAFEPVDRLKDMQRLDLTPASVSHSNILTFQLADGSLMLARLRFRMLEYFKPIVGPEMAKKLAQVKIELDSSYTSPSYKDGVIYLPGILDLTQDTTCDTLMHEWSHYIIEVLADDPGVRYKVGGAHDLWTKAGNHETAWDEGRAHFMGLIMSRGLDLPTKMDTFYTAGIPGGIQNIQDAGNSVEGVITRALTNYYVDTGYTRTRDVLKDFLEIHSLSVKNLGHPPRTSSDFFAMKKLQLQQLKQSGQLSSGDAQRQLRELDKIIRQYKISQ